MKNQNAPSILLVDDDPDVQMLYTAHLQEAGYHVRSACDGPSCVVAAQRDLPDLVILDLGLPGDDGEAALLEMRATAELVSTPVLVFSGREATEWAEHSFRVGASAYLQKPVLPETLIEAVRQLLDQGQASEVHLDAAPQAAPAPAVPAVSQNSAPEPTGSLGSLSCPHCGMAVAGLNATLDPQAIQALAQAQQRG